jgi:hypothetical protein
MGIDVVAALAVLITTLLSGGITSLLKEGNASEAILKLLSTFLNIEKPGPGEKTISQLEQMAPREPDVEVGLRTRLEDVRDAFRKQKALAAANRVSNGLLVIGQFIIGGLLTSSFLQEQLSQRLVGGLGLLVLLSSLLRQHFRPDVQAAGCLQRAARLKSLLRQAEDQMFSRLEGVPDAPSVTEIRKLLSDGLTAVEDSALHDAGIGAVTSKQGPAKEGAKRERQRKQKSVSEDDGRKPAPALVAPTIVPKDSDVLGIGDGAITDRGAT